MSSAPEPSIEQFHSPRVCSAAVYPTWTPHTVSVPANSSAAVSSSCCPCILDIPDETTTPAASLSSLSSLSSFSLLSPLSFSSSSSSSSSLSSLSSVSCTTPVTPWHLSCADKTHLCTMELGSGGSGGGGGCSEGAGDCLSSHTKSPADPDTCETVLGLAQDFQTCPASTIECLSAAPGEQVLSDQLLSGSVSAVAEAAAVVAVSGVEEVTVQLIREGSESDGDAAAVAVAAQSIYEGLGEEETQDWSCLESLISESRMELLDLCSRSELAVNLFCEEDVENYMFQEEDTSLAGDVCSLKIRYESFPDGVHERSGDGDTLVQQEVQHLGFFPACTRRDTLTEKPESWDMDRGDTLSTTPVISPASQSLFDFSSSPGESAEFSDDENSCTGSSPDTWLARREHGNLSRENSNSSSQLSYRLRAKRKVAFREDYLYDVDSIEGERNAENRAEKKKAMKIGPKGEKDDDWCPKKKRKSHRKDPPVIIKYIIINRFKGVKHMTVKLGRVDAATSSVCLSEDSLTQYEKLAPLKAFWQSQKEEQLALGSKVKHLNGCKFPPGSGLKKRRHRITKRLRIQRIHAMEKVPAADHIQEVTLSQMITTKPEMLTDNMLASEAGNLLSDCPVGQGGPRRRAVKQVSEDMCKDSKPIPVRKFRSEARLRAKKLADAQARHSMEEEIPSKEVSVCGTPCDSSTSNPQDSKLSTSSNATDKCTFTLNSQGGAASANVAPLPGGYLQTLLEASDSSNSACTSYFPLAQQPQPQQSQPFLLGVPFQPPQSCVLSPPSESELPQSPNACGTGYPAENQQAQGYTADTTHHTDINYPTVWPSQSGETDQIPFPSAIAAQSPMLPSGFPKHTLLTADRKATVGYHAVSGGDSRGVAPSEESLDTEQHQQQLLELEYRLSPSGAQGDGVVGRLVSFDSLGSLSVASSNYSSLSLHEGEGEGEEGEMNDNFLSHCSPQLVLQQSLEEVTPLRESTDLLDISNFTPDKFRHTSLSDMSPPDTPSPSPHLIRQGTGFTTEPGACEVHWECGVVSSELEDVNGSRHTHLLQIHSFGPDDEGEEEGSSKDKGGLKGQKGPKRKGAKSGPKKTKSPKAAKGEQSKSTRQESKSARQIKAILEGKANKGTAGSQSPSAALVGITGEWPGVGSLSDDDQQEFKEPSNILSNIVSGMAEVQRFMQASVEPLWGPCPLPGEQSLQSQTLRILGGPVESGKKRGGANGVGRGKKGSGGGSKNPPKLIPADFFPALGLDCFPVPHRPAHKKMYRHKSSAKFAREELALSKGNAKVSALTATLEKQR
ncbi:hypothetical protein ACEWY4_010104 [Coilia grayii]|uniref:DUF4683 domain-containing protein n=1 Tax=Coilia grayii TaxID=363190 RepID=A0ABD1K8B2_9TELE